MTELNYLAVVAAAVVAFLLSTVWYIGFGTRLAKLADAYATEERPPAWMMMAELLRGALVAVVLAWLTGKVDATGWIEALRLACVLWIGFPVVLLAGSVLHEKVPWRLAAIHAGDWLVKLAAITVIVGTWR
ncbi:DUF1761 domain-containing protein [Sphaerisporangium perillae]|uniref:DUF1761 domain-containing protein n=1 Tax=Sphaerisporangium perillae TaxID=2935860 RepID=UPI00200E276D|nr:DUF1761 domain-containing protein [Sphaerisporangium perillae]